MQTFEEDENWLLDLMNGPNPLCFRCGKRVGKKCSVIYKSGKVKEKVLCDVCADVHVRQHGTEIEWHAPNTECSGQAHALDGSALTQSESQG